MKKFKITLKKSTSGRKKNHQDSVRGLGLKKINHSVVVDSTPENLGMIKLVSYLLHIEEI